MLALSAAILLACPEAPSPTPRGASAASSSSDASTPAAENKAYQLLADQKARAKAVDRQAVDLITADKMNEARALYKSRWNELAQLRLSTAQDETMSQHEREQVDRAHAADQDGVTAVLNKYDEVYGRN